MIRLPHPFLFAVLVLPTLAGIRPALADFALNGDGTVTDSVTGLIWDRCSWGQTLIAAPEPGTCDGTASKHTWQQALGVAVTANTQSYKGRTDWRLPNRNELESLVKITASYPTIDTSVFPGTPGTYYWSSTPYTPNPAVAWVVNFYDGDVGARLHGNGFHVRLVRSGQSFDTFDRLFPTPCGVGLDYTVQQWLMLALPCMPSGNTVAGTFGSGTLADLTTGGYGVSGSGWALFKRTVTTTPSKYEMLAAGDALATGAGYWFKSHEAPADDILQIDGTATPVTVSQADGCASANGCVAVPVSTVSNSNRYNLVGNPFPYLVDWARVRVRVKNGATLIGVYTPSQAAGEATGEAAAGNASPPVMSKQIWIWNGGTYDTWSDQALPVIGHLKYFQSFWVNVLPGAFGRTVELLIPAEELDVLPDTPEFGSRAMPPVPALEPARAPMRAAPRQPWYFAWLDALIPSAAAAEVDADLAPGRGPEERPARGWARRPAQEPASTASDPTIDLLTVEGIFNRGLDPQEAERAAHAQAENEGREWSLRLGVDEPATGLKDHHNFLGQRLTALAGHDSADLIELPPYASPYLTLAFPHPEWGARAGDYATDFRPAQAPNRGGKVRGGLPAADWNFTIRADRPGADVVLRWKGPPEILARSRLIDRATGRTLNPNAASYADGYAVTLTNGSRNFTWRFLGQGARR